MNRSPLLLLPLAGMLLLSWGCANKPAPLDPGLINHVVLITLEDPSDAAELENDCERLLKHIPSVRTYACGGHYDFGRENINSDYTVGLLVSFNDRDGYGAYLEDPGHVALVEKWKTRWTAATIYDIENDTATKPY